MLSDLDILRLRETGDISIRPFDASLLKPASYTFRLGNQLFSLPKLPEIDARDPQLNLISLEFSAETGYLLQPGEFVLGQTLETLSVSTKVAAKADTRSTLARLGLQVILSSTLVEPGQQDSHETLEIVNHGPNPVRIFPGMPFVKYSFSILDTPASHEYAENGTYARQENPLPRE